MNLIDAHVTKVLEKKNFIAPDDWDRPGSEFDIYIVEYWDDGGQSKTPTELWFEKERHVNVDVGYVFQH